MLKWSQCVPDDIVPRWRAPVRIDFCCSEASRGWHSWLVRVPPRDNARRRQQLRVPSCCSALCLASDAPPRVVVVVVVVTIAVAVTVAVFAVVVSRPRKWRLHRRRRRCSSSRPSPSLLQLRLFDCRWWCCCCWTSAPRPRPYANPDCAPGNSTAVAMASAVTTCTACGTCGEWEGDVAHVSSAIFLRHNDVR